MKSVQFFYAVYLINNKVFFLINRKVKKKKNQKSEAVFVSLRLKYINTYFTLPESEKRSICVHSRLLVRLIFQQILPLLLCQKSPAVCVIVKAPCRLFCGKCAQ